MGQTVLIVEDNERTRKVLADIIRNISEEITIIEADGIDLAYRLATQQEVDLFMLDIVMDTTKKDDVSGMIFAEDMRRQPGYRRTPIIFITSLEDPKLYAYSRLHCFQYIEKPFDSEKTREIIEEALGILEKPPANNMVCFKKDGILYPVEKREIMYVVCEKPYTKIVYMQGEFKLNYQPIRALARQLGEEQFLQCNRGTIVNRKFVESIDPVNCAIHLKNREKKDFLVLGNTFKKKFVSEIKNG